MDQNQNFMFDIEALENEAILKKRTTLALIYMKNVKKWLNSKKTDSFRRNMEIIEKTLNGLIKNITLKMLEDLRTLLQKIFDDPQPSPIEISSDEDEGMSSEKTYSTDRHGNVQQDLKLDTQNHITSTDDDNSPTSTKRIATDSTASSLSQGSADLRMSILQDLAFETRNSSPLDGVMQPAKIPKQRRISVCSKPTSHADLPSIGIYAIKKTKMVPPSLYAKPKNIAENSLRKTTTVPYKSATIRENLHDPQKDAIKLAGIKEKIYAKNYLQLDADKKVKMQEEFINNHQKDESLSSNHDSVIDGEDVQKPNLQNNQRQLEMRKQTLSETQEYEAQSKIPKSDLLKKIGDESKKEIDVKETHTRTRNNIQDSSKNGRAGTTKVRPRKKFEDASKKAHKNSEGKRGRGRPKKTSTVSLQMKKLSQPEPNNDDIEMLDQPQFPSLMKISASKSSSPVPEKFSVAQPANIESTSTLSFPNDDIYEKEEDLLIEVPGKDYRSCPEGGGSS